MAGRISTLRTHMRRGKTRADNADGMQTIRIKQATLAITRRQHQLYGPYKTEPAVWSIQDTWGATRADAPLGGTQAACKARPTAASPTQHH